MVVKWSGGTNREAHKVHAGWDGAPACRPRAGAGRWERQQVHRGQWPEVIAQVPLASGGTVEVHGYATHYTQEWVAVVWNDDNVQHFDCWTPAADVRRPAEGEWNGRFVQH